MFHDRLRWALLPMLVLLSAARVWADEGMWLLNRPPVRQLEEKYGFTPTPAWLEHLQKSCVHMYASGSLVSPDGLLMTNHHVGSHQLEKLSTPERNLIETGFYALTRAEELKCPDMEVQILWSIEDVTDRVNAAGADQPAAEAFAARRNEMTRIEQESQDATGLESQIVTLYLGARYHLYRYQRYTDVRLVMAPEKGSAFFGGDNDNFEYPRFDLDMCFFRIYQNDQPLRSEHYLRWSRNGAADGELTFVLGHPHRTQRLYTVDHLKFLRDVDHPGRLRQLWRREVQLLTFWDRGPEQARISEGDLFGYQNRRKSTFGIYEGLLDPQLFASKRAAEENLRAAVAANPQWQAQWGGAWDQIAAAEGRYREFFLRDSALREGRAFRSDLFRIALTLVELAEELPKPSAERRREYRDAQLESVYRELYSAAPIYDALEVDRLASGLSLLAELFGGDDPLVVKALDGLAPQARAEQIVRHCTLRDVETRKRLAMVGQAGLEAAHDPLIGLARLIDPESRALRKRYEDEVESVERENYAKVAAARFAVFGENGYPDATGTLRLAFGPVKGYFDSGREVPAFTTFAGLYERSAVRQGRPPFDLPARWVARKDKLDLSTPFNFVCTADITGGNSGSPVVNRAGEVVGLVFDSNLPGLIWDIAYSDEQGRAVAVDSRAILAALRQIYDAAALADEIAGE